MNKIKLFYQFPVSEINLLNQLTQWTNNNSVNIISAQTSIAIDTHNSIYLVCTVVYTDDEIKL